MRRVATPSASSTTLTAADAPSRKLSTRPPSGTSTNASGGAQTAIAAIGNAAAQGAARRHCVGADSARYPAATDSSPALGPSAGASSTPNKSGANAAPSVFAPRARPNDTPAAFARALRSLNKAPITIVGSAKARSASAASAAIACVMSMPQRSSHPDLNPSANQRLAMPKRQLAASAIGKWAPSAAASLRRASQREWTAAPSAVPTR